MSETGRITQHELLGLPRWARVAFAAHCLRRAQPLLRAGGESAAVLRRALDRIEQAARTASAEGLDEDAASAYTLALDNLDGKQAADANENDTVVTCMVAHATAFAAEAATLGEPRRAAQLVAQTADFAVHAFRVARTGQPGASVAGMRADLARLQAAAARHSWDDRSAVAP
jgi:hypothetical protein